MEGFTWILAVFALLVIGSYAEECKDETPLKCSLSKDKYCSGENEWETFRQRCKKSCGLCETSESTQETTIKEECKDISPETCAGSKDKYCSGKYEWDWFKNRCKKSCGLCETSESTQETTDKEGGESTQETTDEEECKDTIPLYCSLSKDRFCSGEEKSEKFRGLCMKSCGLCETSESTQEATDKEGSESTKESIGEDGSESTQETTGEEGSESTQETTDEEAVATECKDESTRCENYKKKNNLNCNFSFEKKYCKKTCNLCNDNGGAGKMTTDKEGSESTQETTDKEGSKSTQETTDKEGSESTQETTDKEGSESTQETTDEEGCMDKSTLCNFYDTEGWLDCTLSSYREECKKTCNLCDDNGGTEIDSQIITDAEKRQESEGCKDTYPLYCERDTNTCESSFVKRYCKKTCNSCNTGCWDKSRHCSYYHAERELDCTLSFYREECRKTCGLCRDNGRIY